MGAELTMMDIAWHNNRGRLDRVSVGAQVRADYVYDALERLALRTTQNMTPSGTTHYVHDRAGEGVPVSRAWPNRDN
jgi:hypothetical protein